MNPITFSKIEFSVHPTGSYTGTIISVDDKGKIDTQYGLKHKITVRVESNAANNGSHTVGLHSQGRDTHRAEEYQGAGPRDPNASYQDRRAEQI